MSRYRFHGLASCAMVLALVLPSCQSNGPADLLGRWEFRFEDQIHGFAYEFYEDGAAAASDSPELFPPSAGPLTYTYDGETGLLSMTIRMGGGMPDKTANYSISFTPDDELVMTQVVPANSALPEPKPYTFVRAPLPELPMQARAKVRRAVDLGDELTLLDAHKLTADWIKELGLPADLAFLYLPDESWIATGQVERWLVTVQVEGEPEPKSFILQKWENEEEWDLMGLPEVVTD